MQPSTLVPRSRKIFHYSFPCRNLLLLCLWCYGTAAAFGQSILPRSPARPSSGQDLRAFAAMDQPDAEAAPHHKSTQRKPDVEKSDKYDVKRIGERRVDKGFNMYSIEQEQAMGRSMAEGIERHARLLNDPVVNHYIEQLGQRLVRNSDARIPFTIKVIDSEQVNAFALPGGYLYVDTGLILAAQNESELAAVMAHEIAHVAARHATRNMSKVRLWNMASIPFLFLGGPVSMAVHQVSGMAYPFSVMKFSRDAEREADLLGIEYEYAAGYDPAAFVNFFERLKTDPLSKHFMARVFATHPMNHERIERAQKEIATMLPGRAEYVVDTSDFEEARQRLLQDSGDALVLRRNRERNDGPVLRRRTMDDVPPAVRHFGIPTHE
jgi:beta-barrel assembly-enhancing protease